MAEGEILRLTKRLVSFKTTADNPKELKKCIDFIEGYFKDCDLVVRRFVRNNKHNLVVTFSKTKKVELFLVVHVDVVPAEDRLFVPKVKGNRLFGRGVLDNKSNTAIGMVLMKHYAKQVEMPNIGLIITSDEEVSGKDGAKMLLSKGYSCKFAIVLDGGEPYHVVIKEKGALHVKLSAQGKDAHGSAPWNGENAIDRLINVYLELRKKFPKSDGKHSWRNTISLGKINGGSAVNKVAENAEMWIDMRFVRDKDKAKMLDWLNTLKNIKVDVLSDAKLVSTPKNNPYVRKLMKSVKQVAGKAYYGKELGASDARHFADKKIPTVVMWPKGGSCHSKHEWVDIKSLDKLYEILRYFVDCNISKI